MGKFILLRAAHILDRNWEPTENEAHCIVLEPVYDQNGKEYIINKVDELEIHSITTNDAKEFILNEVVMLSQAELKDKKIREDCLSYLSYRYNNLDNWHFDDPQKQFIPLYTNIAIATYHYCGQETGDIVTMKYYLLKVDNCDN
jgi:hypothetical protein